MRAQPLLLLLLLRSDPPRLSEGGLACRGKGPRSKACSINIEALRAAPPEAGSACPQPKPNATELPNCAPISARAAQRQRRRRWWRGEEGARRPGLEGQVLRHVLRSVLRDVLREILRPAFHVLVLLHVLPKGSVGGGMRLLGVDSAAGRLR